MPYFRGIPWKKKTKKTLLEPPAGPIVEAFREYISNEIPSCLIDTSSLHFVSRKEVFRVFQDEIAAVTEAHIQEHIRRLQSDPMVTYHIQRETVLRQIIQEIVQYDILSHRWGENESTSWDITARKRQASKFHKLAQFCKTSRELGRKLAWIDTCCIDKTNAAELSEAIHGMYKWYANSYLCVVHLAESTSYADWINESWFTRGWTLQELLAPKRVKFYNKDWQPFTAHDTNDDRKRENIILLLERVTGISKVVLTADNSQGVRGCTFWEVMSWASKRQTTRIEDKAYCLVGLFRVSIFIAYGEGQRAFSRFVEAVSAKNPSWDVLAWFGQPSAEHFALPLSPISYPTFEPHVGKNRAGVREFTITAHGLSLKSLPPILMEIGSIVEPEGPGKPFLITLKPRPDDESCSGRYGNVVVQCGKTKAKAIHDARRLSACIINHHATRNREQGKLIVGKEYICLLLYSEGGEDDENTWMKLATDNLLRISYLGTPEGASGNKAGEASDLRDGQRGVARPNSIVFSILTTLVRSPASPE